MTLIAVIAALSAATLVQDIPEATETRSVVVTAKRLDATADALKACIARACPPDQEVDAALAHAENLFVDGDYRTARRTLLNTISRVDRRAADYPIAVADIWRAEARISAHLGNPEAMRIGQFEAVDALKAGLENSDQRVHAQRLEIADTLAKQGKIIGARDLYHKVAKDAGRLGLSRLQGTALLRVAILDSTLAQLYPTTYAVRSRASLRRLTEATEPALAPYRDAARLLQAQLTIKRGDAATIDRVVADYAQTPTDKPILIYQPPIVGDVADEAYAQGSTIERRAMQTLEDQWADVTFLIGADGKVRDVELLRESPTLSPEWLKPVTNAIAQRRYAPVAVPAGLNGIRRVERYTLTAFKEAQTGSHLQARTAPRIETLDLTAEAPVPSPFAGAKG